MMGCGKSHWAKRLGRKLKTGGYDLDTIIEAYEEQSISEIFANEGEAYFRKKEAMALRWFKDKKTFVLATGGGTPCYHENMQWMNEQGITIWLDEPHEVLASRLCTDKAHRPLIAHLDEAGIKAFLDNRQAERLPYYSQAQYRLEGEITEKSFRACLKFIQ